MNRRRCLSGRPASGLFRRAFLVSVALLMTFGFRVQPCAIAAEAEFSSTNAVAGAKRQWAASVRWENDTFGGTDRFYTDGVSLGVSHTGPSWIDPVADLLPWGQGRRTVGYDVIQAMLTPADTKRAVPDPSDRPYAGVLTVGLTLHVERPNSYHGLKLVTGVVGSWSLAEETQREVHRLIGSGEPQGWDYQLENEPVLDLVYEYRRRFRLAGDREGWIAELLPIAGGWVGNMLTQGEAGGLLRFGYRVPDDFGPTLVRGMGHMPPPRRWGGSPEGPGWGFSIYGGCMINLVLRDITLDGNTFENSPSVDKQYLVPMAGVGVAVGNRHFQTSFTYVFWGKEFEGQQDYSEFGAITLTYFF